MAVYKCPKGHTSGEADFCSECGAKIAGAAGGSAQAAGAVCPDCSAPRTGDSGNFCEVCGYNFLTGAHGELAVPPAAAVPVSRAAASAAAAPAASQDADALQPAPAASAWELVVSVSARIDPASPEPPAGFQPITFRVEKDTNLIGRRSESRAIFPELALDFDDAVSHRHALVFRSAAGELRVRDIGSSNGTRLNGTDLPAGTDAVLKDGDEIVLGHWTHIVVKLAA